MSNSWTITDPSSTVELEDGPPSPPVHPGEILVMEFMEPLELSVDRVAEAMALPKHELVDFIEGRSPVNAELALRLAHAFSIDADFWMRLQSHHDLELIRRAGGVDLDHLPILHAAE